MYCRRRSFKTSPTSTIDEDEALSPTESGSNRGSLSEGTADLGPYEFDEKREDELRYRELEETRIRPIVKLGRSVSACERVRYRVPRINRLVAQESNESNDSEDDLMAKPFDSLPMLSAPANIDKKSRLFRFSPDSESLVKPRSRLLEKPDFSHGQYAQFSSRSAECVLDPTGHGRYLDESTGHISEEGTPENSITSRTPTPPADEPKEPVRSPVTPQIEAPLIPPVPIEPRELVTRRKPPMKFLKRAQSLSYVFKRSSKPEKRKKIVRDDFAALTAPREPQGELALVPLEKLVVIDDIQMQPSLSSYNVYGE